MNLIKNNKKVINGWCMYDWANSVYSLTITTAVFPSYFYGITGGKDAIVDFFGIQVQNTVLYSYALSISFLLIAFINPVLSTIADYTGNKKRFMQFFCYLGSVACCALYFFDTSEMVGYGVIAFSLAAVGFAGSLVFYNSFLPEIATEDRFDRISAKGFSLGYIGSVLLLLFNLAMIQMPDVFGLTDAQGNVDATWAPRISFLTVGVWWAGFAQITFNRLPNNVYNRKVKKDIIKKGFLRLREIWHQAGELPSLRKYLIAFGFYSLGVQTVMYLATIYGEDVVGMKIDELIILVLILQLIAIPGAYFFSFLSEKKGNILSLSVSLIIWVGICIAAFLIKDGMKLEFYIVAVFVGMVMGGVQSLSRSTYSKLIPAHVTEHASFFSFFETLEKVSIAAGTFVYAIVLQITGKMNYSALVLTVFFIIGVILLRGVKVKTY